MQIFSFVKKVFVLGLTVLSSSITGALNCVSINNQKCKVRLEIVDVSSNNPIFYPFSLKSTSHLKMSRTNETRHICICRLDKIICNSKQRRNEDKCRCKCKELIDKGVCDKGYVSNPSNCECECDKSCNGEYIDYSSCKSRKRNVQLRNVQKLLMRQN